MTTKTENNMPRVWIGSWAAYNLGFHVGDWFDIDPNLDALEFETMVKDRLVEISSQIPSLRWQKISMSAYELLDEIDVFDREYIPDQINVMSSDGYEKITDALKILDPHEYNIWLILIDQGVEKDPQNISDSYEGCFENTSDFTDVIADDLINGSNWPDQIRSYFDYDKYNYEVMMDYGSERCTYCNDIAIYNSWS
jgi:antirestriction protein